MRRFLILVLLAASLWPGAGPRAQATADQLNKLSLESLTTPAPGGNPGPSYARRSYRRPSYGAPYRGYRARSYRHYRASPHRFAGSHYGARRGRGYAAVRRHVSRHGYSHYRRHHRR